MSANEVAAAALLSVLVGLPVLGLIGWLMTKPKRNRRTGLPRPWQDPRDVMTLHRRTLDEQRARRI